MTDPKPSGSLSGTLSLGSAANAVSKPGGAQADNAGLSEPAPFFAAVRKAFGPLKQSQVDGLNLLVAAMRGWPLAYAAYGLATAWHETAKSCEPVEEAYYLGAGAEAYRRRLRYYPWHGRGYVQLTWEENYRRADDALGYGGRLLADRAKAMDPLVAARIMRHGMEGGWFTGKALRHYLPTKGKADHRQFALARYIINGQDKAAKIADHALIFQDALEAGGWR